MKYYVTFYQCGVEGFDAEYYPTLRIARKVAVEFLQGFTGALSNGHRYEGSVYRDGYAAIRDYFGGTEALAEIHKGTTS